MLGAFADETGTTFKTWALGHRTASVTIEGAGVFELEPLDHGYFGRHVPDIGVGARYKFVFDDQPAIPDLASRWQPDGNDGPSVVVDETYAWTDQAWTGPRPLDQVIYELHIGSFTPQGTWAAAAQKLEHLKNLGVTILQLMPVATFRGAFGWGYDTSLPYAPFAPYGSPAKMKAFVDAAHALGLGVILDVVYNHAGIGNFFAATSEHFFTTRYQNEWGASFNYDDYENGAQAVRDFVLGNAAYWIESFHLDGLRIDAVQALFDQSDEHIVVQIVRAARAAADPRTAYIVVENQPQQRRMIEPFEVGGFGVDAMYNDDFQHSMRVAATGHNDFYYRDYRGTAQELVSSLKYGFLYQGQRSNMREKAYGTCNLETPAHHFLHFLENHDQVANSATGARLTSLMSPARLRAITALLLLGPQTPCLFQGQEFASSRPFLYFTGIQGEDARKVAAGRRESLSNFPSLADPIMQQTLADPSSVETFERSKLDWSEAISHQPMLSLHQDLLALRRSAPAFGQVSSRRVDGAVLSESALLLRYIMPDPAEHQLLLVNLGRDIAMAVIPEPLLAPPDGHRWTLQWSSEHPQYGGAGRHHFDPQGIWILPADCAMLLSAQVL